MEWILDHVDRLYELYGRHLDRLRSDVTEANRSLGSARPEQTDLRLLSRAEFEDLLKHATDDPEVTRLWVRRIIRGHEHEFPELDSVASEGRQRGTGT